MRSSQAFVSSVKRESSRASTGRVQDTLEKLGITYHEHLVSDQVKIASIIKEKQARFAQNPYSMVCFREYITVLTVFGYEKEALEITRSLQPMQYLKLSLDPSEYHPRKKYALVEQYLSLPEKAWSLLLRMGRLGLLVLFLFVYMDPAKDELGDAMSGIVSKMLVGEEPKPTAKPNVRFSDIIVAERDQGIDEYRAEVEELVDFLKDPEKYITAGAKMPKGILFHGSFG